MLAKTLQREKQEAVSTAVVASSQLLRRGKTWCVPTAAAAAVAVEAYAKSSSSRSARSRSPPRLCSSIGDGLPGQVGPHNSEVWKLCQKVVPLCSNVTLLFLQELRVMQRSMQNINEEEMTSYLFGRPQRKFLEEEGGSRRLSIQELCDGSWISRLPANTSAAWLHVDQQRHTLHISRSVDAGLDLPCHGAVVSHCIELSQGLVEGLVDKLASIHRRNGEQVRETFQKSDAEKKSQATKAEFWQSRKAFDSQLAEVAKELQDELLGAWRCLLAPWPQGEARATLLAALRVWLDGEANNLASADFIFPRPSPQAGTCPDRSDCQRFWILALLFIHSESMDLSEIAQVLSAAVLLPSRSRSRATVLRGSRLQRLASSLKKHRHEMKGGESQDLPLLLFVDSVTAQLPIEACPCLKRREIVRGLAPNMILSASRGERSKPSCGYFVFDPAEDCSGMGDVKNLLKQLSSRDQGQWKGRFSKPMPEAAEILENLREKDIFVYLGHGECARRLLRNEQLQLGGGAAATTPWPASDCSGHSNSSAKRSDSSKFQIRGLRSALVLMGCSSVKMDRPATSQEAGGDFESFGLASSALLGGSPLVLGAQWDVLGGDLDKLARHLLEAWLSGLELLPALRQARQKCFMPHLTGAAVVCYGIPM